jgi:hypothetical protein
MGDDLPTSNEQVGPGRFTMMVGDALESPDRRARVTVRTARDFPRR